MDDQSEQLPGNNGKPLGKSLKTNTQGGKDNRLQKTNRHVSSALPDRAKTQKAEEEVERQILLQKIIKRDPRAANITYPAETRADVLLRRREGMSARQIARLKGYPSYRTLHDWRESDPAFAEWWEKEYDLFAAEEAEEVLPGLIKPMRHVRGLKGTGKIYAMKTQAELTLRVASTRNPRKWGPEKEEGQEVIVFEPYGGWVPTNILKGSPGQGAEGEAAAERWKKIREAAKEEQDADA